MANSSIPASRSRNPDNDLTAVPELPILSTLALLYRFCSQSMRFPEPAWFNQEYLVCLYALLDQIGGREEKVALRAAFCKSPEAHLEELQTEYTRLFINGIPHVAAPPYGSVYLDGSLQGKSADGVLEFYLEKGFQVRDRTVPPDHISHQLDFLALLVERGDIEAERAFLSSCFFPWFDQFHDRVLREAHHPLYRTIVLIIAYFTKEEDKHGIHGFTA